MAADYSINVRIQGYEAGIKDLAKSYELEKARIEGDLIKIRMGADEKELLNVEKMIKSFSKEDLAKITLSVDGSGVLKQLDSLTKYIGQNGTDAGQLFQKNIQEGFSRLSWEELLERNLGSDKRKWSSNAVSGILKDLMNSAQQTLQKKIDGKKGIMPIIQETQAYEQLLSVIQELSIAENEIKSGKRQDVKWINGILGKSEIDISSLKGAINSKYTDIGKMLSIGDFTQDFRKELTDAFEKVENNIRSFAKSLMVTFKEIGTGLTGDGTGNGTGTGTGSGDGTGVGGAINTEMDQLINELKEAEKKLEEAKNEKEKLEKEAKKIKLDKLTPGQRLQAQGNIKAQILSMKEEFDKIGDVTKIAKARAKEYLDLVATYNKVGGQIKEDDPINILRGDIEEKLFDFEIEGKPLKELTFIDNTAIQAQITLIEQLTTKIAELNKRKEEMMKGGKGGSGTGTSDGGEAGTTVPVHPDASNFIKELEEQIAGQTVDIKVKPNSDGFIDELKNKVADGINVDVKTNTVKENLQQNKDVAKRVTYHYGDISSNGRLSHQFGDEATGWFSGRQNGGRGWADGTGTYVTADASQYNKGDFSDSLKRFYSIDTSNLKLFEAHTEEAAQEYYDFIHRIEQFCIKIGSGFTGFDDNLKDIDVNSLYQTFQKVFNDSKLTFEQFSSFIDNMVALVKESGLKADGTQNAKEMMFFKKKNGADDIKTRLMKMLGYQGSDLSGTSFDTLRDGSVLFDTANVKDNIIKTGKTIQDVITDINKKSENTVSNAVDVPVDSDATDFIAKIKQQISGQSVDIDVRPNTENFLSTIKEEISEGISLNIKPIWTTGNQESKSRERSKEETHEVSRKKADGTEVRHTTKTSSSTSQETVTAPSVGNISGATSAMDELKQAQNSVASAAQAAGTQGANAMNKIAQAASEAVQQTKNLSNAWNTRDLFKNWATVPSDAERGTFIDSSTGLSLSSVTGKTGRSLDLDLLRKVFNKNKENMSEGKGTPVDYIIHTHPEAQKASLSNADIRGAMDYLGDGIRGIISVAGDEIAKLDVKSLIDNGLNMDSLFVEWQVEYNKIIADMFPELNTPWKDVVKEVENIEDVLFKTIMDSLSYQDFDTNSNEISDSVNTLVEKLANQIRSYADNDDKIAFGDVINNTLNDYIQDFVASLKTTDVNADDIRYDLEDALYYSHPNLDKTERFKEINDEIKEAKTTQQYYSQQALKTALQRMSTGVDLSQFFTVQSRDDLLNSMGLKSLFGEKKVSAEIDVSDVRAQAEKAFDEPFKAKVSVDMQDVKKEIEGEQESTEISPQLKPEYGSLRSLIQDELSQPFDVTLKPNGSLRDDIEEMLKGTFQINVDGNGQIQSANTTTGKTATRGQSPSELIYDMLKADEWMQKNFTGEGGFGPLKERAMFFSSSTGYHTNPFIFDKESSISSYKIVNDIPKEDFEKYKVDSQMHSHPEKYAFMSINNYDENTGRYSGDLSAFIQRYINDGIKNQVIAAQKDVQLLDFDSFIKDHGSRLGDVDSKTGEFFRNDSKEQAFIKEFDDNYKKRKKSFFKNIDDVLSVKNVMDNSTIDFADLFNTKRAGKNTDSDLLSVVLSSYAGYGGSKNTKGISDHFWKYIEDNKENISGGFGEAMKKYIGDAFFDFKAKGKTFRGKSVTQSQYEDVIDSFDPEAMKQVVQRKFATRGNGDPFDVMHKIASLHAFEDMGIDFSKYNKFMSMDDFKNYYATADVSSGFIPNGTTQNTPLSIDTTDIVSQIRAAVSAGGPYPIEIDSTTLQSDIQQAITGGQPYSIGDLTIEDQSKLPNDIRTAINNGNPYYVDVEINPESSLIQSIQDALKQGKFEVNPTIGNPTATDESSQSPISSDGTQLGRLVQFWNNSNKNSISQGKDVFENAAYFNTNTGEITSYVEGEAGHLSQELIDSIFNNAKIAVNGAIHTHGDWNKAAFSPGDLMTAYNDVLRGIKTQVLMSMEEVMTLDLNGVKGWDLEDIIREYQARSEQAKQRLTDQGITDIDTLQVEFQKILKELFDAKGLSSHLQLESLPDWLARNKPLDHKQFTPQIARPNETPVLKSPSQAFDNEVQQNLVSLENYKNTIAEIDKLKLEPETEETKAKLEELNTLADYFASKITTIHGEGGSIDGTFMRDRVTGGFTQRLRSKYTDEQLTQMQQIARERYGVSSKMEMPQFTKIGSELSNIEAKSEGMRQSLNKSLLESSSYVKQLEKSFIELIQLKLELKVETNKKDIEDYQHDMNEILSKYPQLQQFIDQFSTEEASWEFVKTDKWNDFLATLPQAHTYLESLGYDFEKINKPDDTVAGQDSGVLRQSVQEELQTINETVPSETASLDVLIAKIREVAQAVDIKTNAFREEGEVVSGAVQEEISVLTALDGWITMIAQDLKQLTDSLANLPEIELKLKTGENGSVFDENLKKQFQELKDVFANFNTQSISSIGEEINKIKFSDKNIENIGKLSEAITRLVEKLKELDGQDFSGGAFSSIKDLLANADALKDLAKILQESEEKLKNAATVIRDRDKTPEAAEMQRRAAEIEAAAKKKMQEVGGDDTILTLEKMYDSEGNLKEAILTTRRRIMDDAQNEVEQIEKFNIHWDKYGDELYTARMEKDDYSKVQKEYESNLAKQVAIYEKLRNRQAKGETLTSGEESQLNAATAALQNLNEQRQQGIVLTQAQADAVQRMQIVDESIKTKEEAEAYKNLIQVIQDFGDAKTRMNNLEAKAVLDESIRETHEYKEALEELAKAGQKANEAIARFAGEGRFASTEQIAEIDDMLQKAALGSAKSRDAIDVANKKVIDDELNNNVRDYSKYKMKQAKGETLTESETNAYNAASAALEQLIQKKKQNIQLTKEEQSALNTKTAVDQTAAEISQTQAVKEYVAAVKELINAQEKLNKSPSSQQAKNLLTGAQSRKNKAQTELDKYTLRENERLEKIQADYALSQSQESKVEFNPKNTVFSTENVKNGEQILSMYQKLQKYASLYYSLLEKAATGDITEEQRHSLDLLNKQFEEAFDFNKVKKIAANFGQGFVTATEDAQKFFKEVTDSAEETARTSRGNQYTKKIDGLLKKENVTNEYNTKLTETLDLINQLNSKEIDPKVNEKEIQKLRTDIEKNILDLSTNKGYLKADPSRVQKLQTDISTWVSNNGAALTRFGPEIKEIQDALNNVSTKGTQADVEKLADSFNHVKQAAADAGATGGSFGDKLRAKIKDLSGYLMTYVGFQDIVRYSQQAFSTIVELDTALVDLKKTAKMSTDEMERFYLDSNKAAKEYGVTTAELIQQASDWSRLGYNTNESATRMAKLSAQFAAISPGMDTEMATTGLVSVMKAYDIDVNNVLDGIESKINAVGKKLPNLQQYNGMNNLS